MAEALAAVAVVASVAQLADYGFKLSIKLFAYSEAVYKADKTIRSFSNEVSLTSAVLKELASIFSSKESRFVSPRAIEATEQTVKECLEVFDQLNAILEKSMGGGVQNDKSTTSNVGAAKMSTFDKLKWPFLQPKVDLLRSNLDRLKASLTLMLQVLSFARDLAKEAQSDSTTALQKQMIESLARSEVEATQRYNQMLRLLHAQSVPSDDTSGSRDVDATGTGAPPPYINTHVIPTHSNAMQVSDPILLPVKLPLCFELILDVLREHQGRSSGQNDRRHRRYTQLEQYIVAARSLENGELERSLGSAAQKVSAKVSKDRLELSRMLDYTATRYRPLLALEYLDTDAELSTPGLAHSSSLASNADVNPILPTRSSHPLTQIPQHPVSNSTASRFDRRSDAEERSFHRSGKHRRRDDDEVAKPLEASGRYTSSIRRSDHERHTSSVPQRLYESPLRTTRPSNQTSSSTGPQAVAHRSEKHEGQLSSRLDAPWSGEDEYLINARLDELDKQRERLSLRTSHSAKESASAKESRRSGPLRRKASKDNLRVEPELIADSRVMQGWEDAVAGLHSGAATSDADGGSSDEADEADYDSAISSDRDDSKFATTRKLEFAFVDESSTAQDDDDNDDVVGRLLKEWTTISS